MSRICLVGAGFIARVHADALRALPGHSITAIVDPNAEAAASLARATGAGATFGSVAEAIAAGGFDRAHVLVPPDLHASTAEPLLRAGIPVLLEKPLAVDGAQCDALIAAAGQGGAALGVNQNFVHHPAFAKLRAVVESGAIGRPNFVGVIYNVALRQMAARQFGHWMFRAPGNILLEQAVHPLSQLVALAGPIQAIQALPGRAIEIAPGRDFVGTLNLSVQGALLPAQLRFAVGQGFPFWQVTVVGDDGVAVADILADRCHVQGRTRWLEAADTALSGLRSAGAIAAGAVGGLVKYSLAMAKLRPRGDAFFVSMRESIASFHGALDAGRAPALDGAFGAALVRACEEIRDLALPAATPVPAKVQPEAWDVAVLGGTGFIGTHVVRQLLAAGHRVSVMARNLVNLPGEFADPRVALHRGDIRDEAAVARAIGPAKLVVNLAHGGGGADFEAVRRAMVGGAETVARACQAAGVARLVHVGSIASLYLGPDAGTITGATPPDPREAERGDYARAKVLADRMLMEMHAKEGLPVVILRPGVVVGEGGPPLHSGLGLFNNDQHCIGWNDGRNPLPFVLVEDVASAIVRACAAEGVEGRCYNIVGEVRPSAREYLADMGQALGRPLRFHPQSPTRLWLVDVAKWLVKRATGRAVPMPAKRDFLSRGMAAAFDVADARRDLGWAPVADPAVFRARAIDVQAPS
jgi:nucleoside-diphosphate-sugar epimerase/predicted dehydrogenase